MKTALVLSFKAMLFFSSWSAQSAQLPCGAKVGGEWDFGKVPSACDVRPFHTHDFVISQYGPILFEDARSADNGREAYMGQMYPVARDMAQYYIRRRNPAVTKAEEEAFAHAIYSVITQESMWTHYRRGEDGIVRSMRGDSLHGYGLMQIDDRFHTEDINKGKGVDLASNMLMGLDEYYANWVRSAGVRCVKSRTDWQARARSAWSAYNGGPGNICRWSRAKNRHAKKDASYKSNYLGKRWLALVADVNAPAALDVRCLAEGRRPCVVSGRQLSSAE